VALKNILSVHALVSNTPSVVIQQIDDDSGWSFWRNMIGSMLKNKIILLVIYYKICVT